MSDSGEGAEGEGFCAVAGYSEPPWHSFPNTSAVESLQKVVWCCDALESTDQSDRLCKDLNHSVVVESSAAIQERWDETSRYKQCVLPPRDDGQYRSLYSLVDVAHEPIHGAPIVRHAFAAFVIGGVLRTLLETGAQRDESLLLSKLDAVVLPALEL